VYYTNVIIIVIIIISEFDWLMFLCREATIAFAWERPW